MTVDYRKIFSLLILNVAVCSLIGCDKTKSSGSSSGVATPTTNNSEKGKLPPPKEETIVDISAYLPKNYLSQGIASTTSYSRATHINNAGQVAGYFSGQIGDRAGSADTKAAFLYSGSSTLQYPTGMAEPGYLYENGMMAGDTKLNNGAIIYEGGVAKKGMATAWGVHIASIGTYQNHIRYLFGNLAENKQGFIDALPNVGFIYDVQAQTTALMNPKQTAEGLPIASTNLADVSGDDNVLYYTLNITYSTTTKEAGSVNYLHICSRVQHLQTSQKDGSVLKVTELPLLPGTTSGSATKANHAGQVIGFCNTDVLDAQRRGFLFSKGQMTDLGSLGGGYTVPATINSAGDVVGVSTTVAGVRHAFLYKNGKMVDLNDYVKGMGWELSEASGINDKGQICGTGSHSLPGETQSSTASRAYLLTLPH